MKAVFVAAFLRDNFYHNINNQQMRKAKLYILALAPVYFMAGCASLQQTAANVDMQRVAQAGATAATAITITDQDIVEMCRQAMELNDSKSQIAASGSAYAQRLERLTSGLSNYDGLKLNFKVYMTDEINAFASGDGSVRVYSGLMDVMDDNELMAIVGHEIGHVKNKDTKDAVKNAYMTAAAREAIGAAGGTIGKLSDSVLGDIAQTFTSAQYSQKQENEADDYGFKFTTTNGYDPYAMANSMKKLLELSGNSSQSSMLTQAFSSHPDTAAREKRMREKADAYIKAQGK